MGWSRLRTILSIGGGQIVALRCLEGRVANGERRTGAATDAPIVGATGRQILMCGAAEGWRLRWWAVVGVTRWYLVCGYGCNEKQKCVCVRVCVFK